MSQTARVDFGAGQFATSRRGGLTSAEIREIEAHRSKERPTPWSALAKRYGRCEADLRSAMSMSASIIEADAIAPEPRGEWSADEITLLQLLFIDMKKPMGEIVRILDRDECNIKWKLRSLGLVRRGNRETCRRGHDMQPGKSICTECERIRSAMRHERRRAA